MGWTEKRWSGVVFLALGACVSAEPGAGFDAAHQGTPAAERIHIENDRSVLAERVHIVSEMLPLKGPQAATSSITLELVAQVDPPTVRGHSPEQFGDHENHDPSELPLVGLHATSVSIDGDTAIVVYHYASEIYAGAVEVYDVSDPERPVLTSYAHFDHLDLSTAVYQPASGGADGDGLLFTVSATCDALYQPWTAAVEKLVVTDGQLTHEGSFRFGLYGYIGTSVASDGQLLYATSGTGGGLLVADPLAEQRVADIALDDARWVDVYQDRLAVLSGGGAGAKLSVYDTGTLELVARHDVPGARRIDSKNTVEVARGLAYVAAGAAGVQVIDLETGKVEDSAPLPQDSGYDPADVVTNAVSTDGDLVFAANGGVGVGVYHRPSLRHLGTLDIDGSVNHVAYRAGLLFVAGGSEGLHIIRVRGAQ